MARRDAQVLVVGSGAGGAVTALELARRGIDVLVLEEGARFSQADYGCLWAGDRRGGPASREEIRAAHEFGQNLLDWAAERARR